MSCFLVTFSCFPCFLVFSRARSPHPAVPFRSGERKASLSALSSERHYRVRGKVSGKHCFLRVFSCFLCFSRQLQAAPLISLARSAQKVTFHQKRQLLLVLAQSDEWGRLNLMLRTSFSREKLYFSNREIWCIPMSFSDRNSCVKGGVFFPISESSFS